MHISKWPPGTTIENNAAIFFAEKMVYAALTNVLASLSHVFCVNDPQLSYFIRLSPHSHHRREH